MAMRRLMEARSVAVVGASDRPDASSGFVIRNLRAHGFSGRVLPVNPRTATVASLPAAPDLTRLDQRPDAVVVAVAAEAAVSAVEEAAGLDIKAAVVLASGFAETGEAGKSLQERLARAARSADMALCGPNCLGLHVAASGLSMFSSTLSPRLRKGNVALVSHSGAGAITLAHSGRIGVSHIVSAGNAATTNVADYLAYFAASGATQVVALLLEQIGDPIAFAEAMEAAHRAGLPVVALRSGRSERGARSAATHTGALAGSNEAFAAFFRQHGVIETESYDELVETAALLSSPRWRNVRGPIAVTGVSGGGLAHFADLADASGIGYADLSDATRTSINALLPAFVRAANPLDLTGLVFGEPERYRGALEHLASDRGVAAIVAVQDAPQGLDDAGAMEYAGIADAIVGFGGAGAKPIAFLSLLAGGPHVAILERLDRANVPTLQGAAGVKALGHCLADSARRIPAASPAAPQIPAWVERLSSGPRLSEREAKNFLDAHGLAVTRECLARTREEALSAARDIGFPVVLKIDSPDIPHKTEAGGVRLGIADEAGVIAAFDDIVTCARRFAPEAKIAGVLVQEMIVGGVEALLGLSRHEPFGLALAVGPGGVHVELMGGHALCLPPLDTAGARAAINVTRLAPLIAGYRGGPALDCEALATAMVRLGSMAETYGEWIEGIDLNPVAVLPEGIRVLDALVVRRIDARSTGRESDPNGSSAPPSGLKG